MNDKLKIPLAPVVTTEGTLSAMKSRENHMTEPTDTSIPRDDRKNWAAMGGLIGAALASSCCVLPLVLVSLGVTGTWIGSLTALEPYKPWFIAVAVALIGYGFWYVYFRKPEPCADDTYCARPESSRLTKTALWLGSIMVLAAATIDYWAPLFY